MEGDMDATVSGDNFTERSEYNRSVDHGVDYGPIRDPLYIVVPISIIYVAIFFAGLLGNVVTCIVIARNRYMHTATNYYLFSLAVSDLLLLVSGLPQEMVAIWYKYPYMFGESFCILRGLSAETSTNASVLTITAFTVERYFAICHPFMSQTMSKLSRAYKFIIVVWLVSLSFALPQAMQFGLVHVDNNPSMVMCVLKRKIIRHSFELSTFLFFITPMTLITVLYILIGVKLRKSNVIKKSGGSFYSNSEEAKSGRKGPSQSSRRVIKMLVAIVVAFFICWAPFHAQRLVYIYGSTDHHSHTSKLMTIVYTVITYVSGVLYYVSTTINPILYHIMSLKFREAFKDTIALWCGLPSSKNHRGRRYSVLQRGQHVQFSPSNSMRTGATHSFDAVLFGAIRDESTTTSTCMNFNTERSTPCDRRSAEKCTNSSPLDEAKRSEIKKWVEPLPTMEPDSERTWEEEAEKSVMGRSRSDESSAASGNSFCSVFQCLRSDYRNKSTNYLPPSTPTSLKFRQEEKFIRTRSSSDSGIVRSRSFCGGFSSNVSNSSLKDYDQRELQEELSAHLAEVFKNGSS